MASANKRPHTSPSAAVAAISACLERGELVQGQELCSESLNRYPTNPNLLHLQGLIHKLQGNSELAINSIEQAIAIAPLTENYYFNLAIIQKEAGHISQAVNTYEHLLKLNSRHHPSIFNLGEIMHGQGRRKEAEELFRRFLQLQPQYSMGYSNLASVLIDKGALDEAWDLCAQAMMHDGQNPHAYTQIGIIHAHRGSFKKAEEAFRDALRIDPGFQLASINLKVMHQNMGCAAGNSPGGHVPIKPDVEALFQQGNVLLEAGQLEKAEAVYRQAMALNPDVPEILTNLGMALNLSRRYAESEQVLLRATHLNPRFALAYLNLGILYKDQKQYEKAASAFQQALSAAPEMLEAQVNLGLSLEESGNVTGAINAYERALTLKPDHAESLAHLIHCLSHVCRWDSIAPRIAQLRHLLEGTNQSAAPFIVALLGDPQLDYVNAMRYSKAKYGALTVSSAHTDLPRRRRGGDKLRIGYLSSDFHYHATAFLMSGMFEKHDRNRFDVYGYSYGPDDASAERKRIAEGCSVFRDFRNVSDRNAAQRIREDGLDILIDLKGLTGDSRLGILAERPAPIQVHYLGYPSTSGTDFIDYFLADPISAPRELDEYFSERLVRLPSSYQVNDAPPVFIGEQPTRSSFGLPDEAFVLCNFNQSYKITRDVFATWMKVLDKVPDSVLWLYESHPQASEAMRAEASRYGINPSRLFFATMLPRLAHLSRLRLADIFLDTCPVNAHTTASDALSVGLPLVTLKGKSFVSRVAASLLNAVECIDLAADSLEQYETVILELARDRQRLTSIRSALRENVDRVPLFDTSATVRQIEACYLHMVALHDAGQQPQSFAISKDLKVNR